MSTKHTPTPWKVFSYPQSNPSVTTNNGEARIICDFELTSFQKDQAQANAAHIVKCVNEREDLLLALQTTVKLLIDQMTERRMDASVIEAYTAHAKNLLNRAKEGV